MGALLLISAIIIGLFLYIKIITFLDHKKYYTQHQNIFTAHKEIGYPNLTEEQQFDILDNENTTYISKLTKYDFVPTGLLNYYINIDPGKYFAHLKNLNLKDKIKFDPTCLKDGFFINKKNMDTNTCLLKGSVFIPGKDFSHTTGYLNMSFTKN